MKRAVTVRMQTKEIIEMGKTESILTEQKWTVLIKPEKAT